MKYSDIITNVKLYGEKEYQKGMIKGRILELEILMDFAKTENLTYEQLKRWKEFYELALEIRKEV